MIDSIQAIILERGAIVHAAASQALLADEAAHLAVAERPSRPRRGATARNQA